MHMAIVPVLSAVSQEVTLNQPYNAATDVDENDVPPECRMYQRSRDENPAEWWDEQRGHDEYEHTLERLYVQGVRAMLSAI
jgi:hypothetical protein